MILRVLEKAVPQLNPVETVSRTVYLLTKKAQRSGYTNGSIFL
jgi:hypothetical protein